MMLSSGDSDTDYKVVFASIQSWQVVAAGGGGGGGDVGGGWCDGRCGENLSCSLKKLFLLPTPFPSSSEPLPSLCTSL